MNEVIIGLQLIAWVGFFALPFLIYRIYNTTDQILLVLFFSLYWTLCAFVSLVGFASLVRW
jgi:hypothetical protein